MSSIAQSDNDLKTNTWQNFNYYAYIQLDKNFKATPAAIEGLNKQINKIYKEHVNEAELKVDFHLQALTSIHLHSNYQVDLPGHGNSAVCKYIFCSCTCLYLLWPVSIL